jgi:hypothetical protein
VLNKGEVLTLNDNKQYTVVYSTEINFKKYAYLIELDNHSNMMLCEYNGNELEEVLDHNIIKEVVEKFNDSLIQ